MLSLGFKTMNTVIQPPGWNPFQTFLLSASVVAGVAGLFVRDKSSGMAAELLPYTVLCIWYVGLVIGGLLGLAGMFIDFKYRLYIKIIGIGLLGGITIAYSLLIAVAGGRPFAYPVIVTFAFSLACIVRTVQLIKILQSPRRSQEVIVHE